MKNFIKFWLYKIRRKIKPPADITGGGGIQNAFQNIYDNFIWNTKGNMFESLSGEGSTIKNTELVRKAIVEVITEFNINKMLDGSCGDWNWMRLLLDKLPEEYTGLDVTPSVIENNKLKYESKRSGVLFINNDMVSYLSQKKEKEFDLILIRHTLEHLPTDYNLRVLKEVVRCSRYALVTSSNVPPESNAADCDFGGFRPLNLLYEPYRAILHDPLRQYNDHVHYEPDGNGYIFLYKF
jgi:hypothetical protein